MKVEGTVRMGETSHAERLQGRALLGLKPWINWLFWGGVVVGGLAGITFAGWSFGLAGLPEDRWGGVAAAIGLIGGIFVAMVLGLALWGRRWRAEMAARGWIDPVPLSVDLTPEAVVISTPEVETRVAWPAIYRLDQVGRFWLLQYRHEPVWIPRRFFTNRDEEKAFISQIIGHMDDAAKARSWAALARVLGNPVR